mgnify:CR=1 FL=1
MALDPVNAKAVKGKFKDREDKDLDNDGDSDASDEYLHKRRSAVSKAIKSVKEAAPKIGVDNVAKIRAQDRANKPAKVKPMSSTQRSLASIRAKSESVKEAKLTPDQMRKALADDKAVAKSKDKVSLKKAPWDMKKEEVKLDEAKKDHFVYQKGVLKTKEVVHRGTEQSSKDWIEKNAKHYSHKGKDFDIYKGKYPNVKPSDRLDYRYVAEEIELDEKYDTPVKKKPVSMMTKDEKDKNDERRKSYKEYQKSLRKEEVEIDEALAPNVVRGDNYVRESNESVSRVFGRMVEAKDNYTVAHKSFSSAVQHAEEIAKKRGFEIDPDVWDRKVAMGPRKPGVGKTNSYNIDLMKNGKDVKQKLHMQVYYDEGRYELNMYIS